MRKLSKRMLSLVLSVLMVVTMLPTFAIPVLAAGDEWHLVSSTDFTKISFTTSDTGDRRYATGTGYQGTDGSSNYMVFDPCQWQNSTFTTTSNGLQITDGFIRMSGYHDSDGTHSGTTPWATSAYGIDHHDFKIDLTFSYYNNDGKSTTASTSYGFFKMLYGSGINYTNTSGVNSNSLLGIYNNGTTYVSGSSTTVTNKKNIVPGSDYVVNSLYHMIVVVEGDKLTAYSTDNSGNVITT
ncbi:MAG: hypothetical protein IJ643_03615, partial [Eubacterium sp.]|nr:hypothetical protein [Eubacterium sp.]